MKMVLIEVKTLHIYVVNIFCAIPKQNNGEIMWTLNTRLCMSL